MHMRMVHDRRLEERGVEPLELVAVAGGALGEQPHPVARGERRVHQLVDARKVAAPLAPHEERARAFHHPAGDRPVADLALGDEPRGTHARDREDIQPGDVVRGDHRAHLALRGRGALHDHLDARDAQQLRRPPSDERAAARAAGTREDRLEDERSGGEVQRHARPAHGAQRPPRAAVNA